jgi:glycosyltransferase involved in cell wall biosynthesis
VRGFPFVTCLCLTRNRRQWLPKAIECFRKQTYQHRELLIIADGEDVRDLVDDSIRLIHMDGPAEIGEKRNFGCSVSRGTLIAHWDDDDYSAPGRLHDQVTRYLETGKSVIGYRSMRFTDGKSWWMYDGATNYAIGTSLMYEKSWWAANPFPAKHIGEDNDFVFRSASAGRLVSTPAGDLMYATIHNGNTSPKDKSSREWKELTA